MGRERLITREHLPVGIAVAVAIAALGLHLSRREAPRPVAAPVADSRASARRAARADEDAAKWRAWREALAPSVLDTGEEREAKQFQRRMRTLGTSPVEVLSGGEEDDGGLAVAKGRDDVEAFLAAGGHYCGPLPPELGRAWEKRRAERRRGGRKQ